MDSSTKFRIARAADIENSDASNKGEDVLIIDEGGKGMYIGTNTTMPSKNIAVGPNQLKTINGESLVGAGDIEIGGSNIVIFNPGGDPAEEHAKLVNAHDNGLPVYFGEIDTNGVLVPMYPAIPSIANEEPLTFLINIFTGAPYAGAAVLVAMACTVTPTNIEMSDNAQLMLSTTGDGTKFLSDNGQYETVTGAYVFDFDKTPQTLFTETLTAFENNKPVFVLVEINHGENVQKMLCQTHIHKYDDNTITISFLGVNTEQASCSFHCIKLVRGSSTIEWLNTGTAIDFTKTLTTDNIKTINGESLVGTGNIDIGGSSDANVQAVDTAETLDDVNDLSNVKYVSQTLTTAQKTVARNNIGAGDVKRSDLSTVATSGSYTDLLNKPTIPNAVTESTVANWGFTKNTGTYSKPYNGIPITDLDNSTQTIINNSISAIQFGDFESIIQTQGFEGSLSGKLYALPDERTGDEDEVIVTTGQAVALGLPTYFEREYNSTAYIKGEGLYDEPNNTRFVLPGTELYDVGTYNDVILTTNTLTKRLITSNKLQSGNTNVVLDSNIMTICECMNNNQYTVKIPTNDYSVADISMGRIRPTYNLELSFVLGPGTIEFDFNAKWANDNPPVFESGYVYHLSFMAQGDTMNITTPVYLGVWTKYKTT